MRLHCGRIATRAVVRHTIRRHVHGAPRQAIRAVQWSGWFWPWQWRQHRMAFLEREEQQRRAHYAAR